MNSGVDPVHVKINSCHRPRMRATQYPRHRRDYWVARPSRAMTRTRDRAMTGFPDKAVMAELTAKMLLEVDAVRFMTDKPFIYTSGWASPVYTDCRRLISFPRVR